MPFPADAQDSVPAVRLVPARSLDADVLVGTQIRAFHDDARRFEPGCRQATPGGPPGYDSRAWQLEMMKRGKYFAIEHFGQVVGGAIAFPIGSGRMNLGRIWIDPAWQGRGIGRAAITQLHERFATTRTWALETPAWAVRNHHICESLGYVRVGQRPCPNGFVEYLYERTAEEPLT